MIISDAFVIECTYLPALYRDGQGYLWVSTTFLVTNNKFQLFSDILNFEWERPRDKGRLYILENSHS